MYVVPTITKRDSATTRAAIRNRNVLRCMIADIVPDGRGQETQKAKSRFLTPLGMTTRIRKQPEERFLTVQADPSQERRGKEKSACSVRNDADGRRRYVGARPGPREARGRRDMCHSDDLKSREDGEPSSPLQEWAEQASLTPEGVSYTPRARFRPSRGRRDKFPRRYKERVG